MANVINWFEIPATDFERARKFYGDVLGSEMPVQEIENIKMAFFNAENDGVGGAVCLGEGYEPSENGVAVYFDGGDDLSDKLAKVEPAGGKVVVPKTLIAPEIGYFAMFLDTEGNRMAFHSKG